jgi:murein DD-endopeptidase MepM/ murein hydrolase activator NlpD
MTCGCSKQEKTNLWTPIPDFTKPTEILPGENIDCYAKRANDDIKDSPAEQLAGRISNTVIVSDLNLQVNEQFKLTPNPPTPAASWSITVDGASGVPSGMGLTFNTSTGALSGTVNESYADKNYKIKITALSSVVAEIDSREFNFYPKKASSEETIKFVWPLQPKGVVTSKFGPRKRPAAGASSDHGGIDIALPGGALGEIVAAADGTVIRCGPGRGWGNVIMIEHRDAQDRLVATTVYGHWSSAYVTVGQKVAAGQRIAKEGNVGVGTGAHLHFELHRGKFKNPIDPLGYLNGEISVAVNNDPQTGAPTGGQETQNRSNTGMTARETETIQSTACPSVLPNQQPPLTPTDPSSPPIPSTPGNADVKSEIQRALDESDLAQDDKDLLMFMAYIESGFKADAKNPTSSARGLFQMLDKTAVRYYDKIGIPATVENRNNPYYATKAQIEFYKSEQLRYWNEFNSSGKTKIAGKTLKPEVSSRYANYNKGEFVYGLIHHDGVGSAVAGKDLQGVDYYRKRVRQA